MNFRQFSIIIDDLQKLSELEASMGKFVKSSCFDIIHKTITDLLEGVYQQSAITYVLFEWLIGNNSAMHIEQPDGSELIYPLDTIHDLWTVMEMYPANNADIDEMDSERLTNEI